MLALTLCGASCATVSHPSVQQTAKGNSYRLLLPAGTRITAPDDATAAQIRALAFNELEPGTGREFVLNRALQLVSPAYIAERNSYEISLLQLITDLKNDKARAQDK